MSQSHHSNLIKNSLLSSPANQTPINKLGSPLRYDVDEIYDLIDAYSDMDPTLRAPVYDVLKATKTFLNATQLNTSKERPQDERNANKNITTQFCHEKLEATALALQTANEKVVELARSTKIGKSTEKGLTLTELKETIAFCEKCITNRVEQLPKSKAGEKDKYYAMYKGSSLKTILDADMPKAIAKPK